MHYAGVGCEMDAILKIAACHGVAVVEDNAHGLFGKYGREYLGTYSVRTCSTGLVHRERGTPAWKMTCNLAGIIPAAS